MIKNKIQTAELNKLYDEIYYSSLEDVEYALDCISNLVSTRELEDEMEDIYTLSDVIEVVIDVLEEIAEIFDNEGLEDEYNFTKDKINRIQKGDMDEVIENDYLKFMEDDLDDELLNEDSYDEIDDVSDYEDLDEYDEY